jgi:hypothetical protein
MTAKEQDGGNSAPLLSPGRQESSGERPMCGPAPYRDCGAVGGNQTAKGQGAVRISVRAGAGKICGLTVRKLEAALAAARKLAAGVRGRRRYRGRHRVPGPGRSLLSRSSQRPPAAVPSGVTTGRLMLAESDGYTL